MKIHYREPNLIEQIETAIRSSHENNKPIDHIELTQEEFNTYFDMFDKSHQRDNSIVYFYKTYPIKVKQ